MPPELIETEAALDEVLTRPSTALIEAVKTLASPLLILGAGGKMGPTLAVRIRRAAQLASHPLDVIAVSRFTDTRARDWLERNGVQTRHADCFKPQDLARLPDAANVLYLVGLKFGTADDPARTWAVNTLVPATVATRYPRARIVALSTGNVYPLAPLKSGGSVESDPLTPLGEYPNAAVARERIFEHYSRENGTPVALIRLNYAVELRYGVLLDIAQRVSDGQPIDLATGYFNCIWQGDANDMIPRALPLTASPPRMLNLTAPAILGVRNIAHKFGVLLGRAPRCVGIEAPTAQLSNPARACALLGNPPTPLETLLRWTAHWVKIGGCTWNKPTHFEVRDGKY
ncbi:MAG: NAD-dependent epimerase/dehydratase family protein [Verrucomicrobia bacterium]|nr:NAD-dependent epimerase/dehydratase family protein [Verrucomicrobiota bacterium]